MKFWPTLLGCLAFLFALASCSPAFADYGATVSWQTGGIASTAAPDLPTSCQAYINLENGPGGIFGSNPQVMYGSGAAYSAGGAGADYCQAANASNGQFDDNIVANFGVSCPDGSVAYNTGPNDAGPWMCHGTAPTSSCTAGSDAGAGSSTGLASPITSGTACVAGCTVTFPDSICGHNSSGWTCEWYQSAQSGASCTGSNGGGSTANSTGTAGSVSPCPAGQNLGTISNGTQTSVACYPASTSSGSGSGSTSVAPVTTTTTSVSTSTDSSGNTVTTTTTITNICDPSGACSQTVSSSSSNGSSSSSKGVGAANPAGSSASGGSGGVGVSCGVGSDCAVKVDESGTQDPAAAGAQVAAAGSGSTGSGGALDTLTGQISGIGSQAVPGTNGDGIDPAAGTAWLPPSSSCSLVVDLGVLGSAGDVCTSPTLALLHMVMAWFWGTCGLLYAWRRGNDAMQDA